MFKTLKKKKGFTLVEMMIVVAILATLVLISTPSFNIFKKADGTAVNAKAKNIETAMFVHDIETGGEAYLGTLLLDVDANLDFFNDNFSGTRADFVTILQNEYGLTGITDTELDAFISEHVKTITKAEITPHIKGSSSDIDNYYVIDINTAAASYTGYSTDVAELDAVDGYVLSKDVIKDKNGSIYAGTMKYVTP